VRVLTEHAGSLPEVEAVSHAIEFFQASTAQLGWTSYGGADAGVRPGLADRAASGGGMAPSPAPSTRARHRTAILPFTHGPACSKARGSHREPPSFTLGLTWRSGARTHAGPVAQLQIS
jgi:hypothetical protein